MKKVASSLLMLSLALGGACAAVGQEKPAGSTSRPKVLQIMREYTKPGKSGMVHDKAESAFVQAMSHAKWPTNYVGMTSLTGKPRALFFTFYDSFEALEKDGGAQAKNATLSAAIDRAGEADGQLLDSMDQGIFYFSDEMSLRPRADLSQVRFLQILSFHVRPGHDEEWTEVMKLVKGAYEKGVPDAHWGMFRQMFGGEGGTFLVLIGRKSLSEIDKGIMQDDMKFAAALGEDGMKKLNEKFGASVDSSQEQLFAINPRMSYVADEWIKADPDFWKPKAAAASATKPAAEDKKAKP
jgi:hypothetical protein